MQILIEGLNFPEGPAFDTDGGVWLVEKNAGNLVYYRDPHYARIFVGGYPNGIAIDPKGKVWFCDAKQNSIRQYDPLSKGCITLAHKIADIPLKMPNDLCFDPNGNLLFTCPGSDLTDGEGYICCLSKEGALKKVYTGMFYCNGLAFGRDNEHFFVAETGTKWIWKMTWDICTHTISRSEKFAYVGGSVGPDGIAVDRDGLLYVALYGSAKIIVLRPSGEIVNEIDIEGNNPTNCALDPLGKQGLLITEAEKGTLLQWGSTKKGLLW
ncbi:SMP-30/gluconolactonase/LRE family protein [Sphingobacterium sp. SGR-19]|uniref:SMP-30/gluconolactonase/LRE family protein n=1 Tax=Sphingobacterium sp. SGR-19 TaxID=2710886 RepID=UPI0013EC8E67|nr:SMP-30/gluconolactonase/LRE family protein [Sphingobacterium sp. SGR-19]NGM66366.1 SMP-30/gluconolactonase/LRE family protein [Sphingobacterium sp. SGR-19]